MDLRIRNPDFHDMDLRIRSPDFHDMDLRIRNPDLYQTQLAPKYLNKKSILSKINVLFVNFIIL